VSTGAKQHHEHPILSQEASQFIPLTRFSCFDPTLSLKMGFSRRLTGNCCPEDQGAYYPGLEFPGRVGIADFVATPQGRQCRKSPFFHAFGWGGMFSPTFRVANEAAMASYDWADRSAQGTLSNSGIRLP
jgi:hypothetical protein